jgi:hypothetical protein
VAQVNPFSTRIPTFTLFPSTAENPFVARSRSLAEVQRLMAAARFPVTRYRLEKGKHIVEYQEFGLSWRPLFRVELNERQEVLAAAWIAH